MQSVRSALVVVLGVGCMACPTSKIAVGNFELNVRGSAMAQSGGGLKLIVSDDPEVCTKHAALACQSPGYLVQDAIQLTVALTGTELRRYAIPDQATVQFVARTASGETFDASAKSGWVTLEAYQPNSTANVTIAADLDTGQALSASLSGQGCPNLELAEPFGGRTCQKSQTTTTCDPTKIYNSCYSVDETCTCGTQQTASHCDFAFHNPQPYDRSITCTCSEIGAGARTCVGYFIDGCCDLTIPPP